MAKAIDLTGQKFGKLTVLERDFFYSKNNNLKTNRPYWKCQCDCGNIKTVLGSSLKQGSTSSCGCLSKEKIKNLTGQKFGMLTVLKMDLNYNKDKSRKRIFWICKCDCGNTTTVETSNLQNGHTKSCGCLHKKGTNKKDITNQRFDHLISLYPTEKRNNHGSVIWKCKCDCGNEKEVAIEHLIRGDTSSCGCIISKGENKIFQILTKNYIPFEKTKNF